MWSQILLILTCILSAAYIYRRLDQSPLFYLLVNLTLFSLVAGHSLNLLDTDILEYTVEVLFLLTMLLALVTLMVSIRLFQPEYLQYPIYYSYVPILILPFYLIYIDNQSLSDLIMMILHISAYTVYTVIIFTHFNGIKNNWLLILSLLFFLTSLVFHWGLNIEYDWVNTFNNLLLSAGIITVSMSFPLLINKSSE